eukprot:494962-Hanusia_phi.AAC.1
MEALERFRSSSGPLESSRDWRLGWQVSDSTQRHSGSLGIGRKRALHVLGNKLHLLLMPWHSALNVRMTHLAPHTRQPRKQRAG